MSSASREGVLAVCSTLMGLSITAVGLRFYARRQQNVHLMTDDWVAVIALVSYAATAICVFIMVRKKVLGYSSKDFSAAHIAAMAETSEKLQITFDVLSTTSLAFTKLAALFFYRRVFCVGIISSLSDIVIRATIVVVILWLIVFQFLTGFQCGTHFSALWNGTYLKYCTISFPFLYGLTISDFLLDVWILAIPIPLVWRLHTTLTRKLSVIGVLLLAFVGLGASIARMAQYISVELGGKTYLLTHDHERTLTQSCYLAMLEAGMSLIAMNIPSVWLLCTKVVPEKVVRSIRSMVSLTSGRSSGGDGTAASPTRRTDSTTNLRNDSTTLSSSQPYLFRGDLEGQKNVKGFVLQDMHSTKNEEHAPSC